MEDEKKDKKELESVKVSKEIVDLVRQQKRETFIPIGTFFELAVKEKLERDNQKTIIN